MTFSSQVQLQNAISAITDAIFSGNPTEDLPRQFHVPEHELDDLVELVYWLHDDMVRIDPETQFTNRLKADLIGSKRLGLPIEVPGMPMRVKVAAGAALMAGFAFVVGRRIIGNDMQEMEDQPVLQ